MKHLICLCCLMLLISLSACGTEAPTSETRSEVEVRQTEVALSGRPTLVAVPAGATPAAPPTAAPLPDVATLLGLTDDDPRALGDPAAPVLIVEFTDYECAFCQRFVAETRGQLIAQFVETGQVRLVVRDFPLSDIHASAIPAAVATHCAAEQGQFWAYSEQLFASHRSEWGGVPNRDRGYFLELARSMGLDEASFSPCLDDPARAQAVRDEQELALRLGVNSTPNFLINGQLVRGAQPLRVFEDLINQLLP
ncbi:DsbA family protein [Candidatus Viridilinea mediisalina]|uniref:Disulfide bond formation protein DsbA n=1 Tax=Candidatus Viridilinea mediisalina TaxID=2024553 RepID=A0A2A6RJJ7_9CHLR|nr:thioredoxin domain-containing protein [Candidatus Viridilinea mediisalina]PDW03020.1 disulfide bond formation protein DsbA [Candidatus Viridilinea mediisalina]